MKKKLPLLDTNVIVRFLTSDSKEQAERAEKLFQSSSKKSLEIPDLVIAEIAYVLLSFYRLPKEEVIEKIHALIDFDKFKTNKKIIKKTLELFKEYNISFVDAYLCSLVFHNKNKFVFSFDRNLLRMKEIRTQTP